MSFELRELPSRVLFTKNKKCVHMCQSIVTLSEIWFLHTVLNVLSDQTVFSSSQNWPSPYNDLPTSKNYLQAYKHTLDNVLVMQWNDCDWMFMLFTVLDHTFLLGECITGAGGDGGPLGIFLFVLKSRRLFYWHTTFNYGPEPIHILSKHWRTTFVQTQSYTS